MRANPEIESTPAAEPCDYDVVVIGGAFAGAATATVLRRLRPATRVLVVEDSASFGHKVGEATVEISAFFLLRVLGLYDHLSREHLPKHGLRYWFSDRPGRRLAEMTEIGPATAPDLPSFQLDRSRLDQHVLELASREGADVLRPAKVTAVDLGWPMNRVEIAGPGGAQREVTARWVIDASGRHAFLARRLRLLERTERHPIAAVWRRWEGVLDLDSSGFLGTDPRQSTIPRLSVSRRLGTNHFCGYGWWCWVIPLACGRTSIGLVYDKQLFEPPGEGDQQARYLDFVRTRPGLRELVKGAVPCADDGLSYQHLPYRSRQYMGRGWALVGDAASFLDPLYSPGLDHVSISVYATARLLESELGGGLPEAELGPRIDEHNATFERAYGRWLDGLYTGKYQLLGDAELTAAAFLVDTSLYYLGVVGPAYRDLDALRNPPFGVALPQARIAYWVARGFNRRLQRLAQRRRETGLYGRRNAGWRLLAPKFRTGPAALRPLLRGLGIWLRLEARQLAQVFLPNRVPARRPQSTEPLPTEPQPTEP